MTQQTEPSFKWTRAAAFIALVNMCALAWRRPDAAAYVYYAHSAVIAYWALGSNGRMALVDAVAKWRK